MQKYLIGVEDIWIWIYRRIIAHHLAMLLESYRSALDNNDTRQFRALLYDMLQAFIIRVY